VTFPVVLSLQVIPELLMLEHGPLQLSRLHALQLPCPGGAAQVHAVPREVPQVIVHVQEADSRATESRVCVVVAPSPS